MNWKPPPVEKIYEAFSVLADGRFEITAEGRAKVASSSGDKFYTVTWSQSASNSIKVNSDDNGSRWQGYTGYPIVAILMITGKIVFNRSILPHFKGIQWKRVNKIYKNNYALAVESILKNIDVNDLKEIRKEVDSIFNQIKSLTIIR